jgi:uncharacterized membrane protein YkvI
VRAHLKTNLKISFVFIGTIVGAGFASGREIASFFGKTNAFMPLLAGVLCGALSFVFLELGRRSGGDFLKELFPKTKNIWNFLVRFANLVIFVAMLAGAEFMLRDAFNFVGGGLLAGFFALAAVLNGTEGIKRISLVTVPLIITLIAVLFFLKPSFEVGGGTNLLPPVLFACFNILSGGYLISRMAKDITKKQCINIAVIIGAVLSTLLVLVFLTVKNNLNSVMPVLEIAQNHSLGFLGFALIFIAVFTALTGTLAVCSNGNRVSAVVMLAAGYIISGIGFATIISYAYPALGVLGAFLSLMATVKLILIEVKKQKTRH